MSVPTEGIDSSLKGLSQKARGELMAVIAAAVTAYGSEEGKAFTIRSVKKATDNPWAAAGINDCIMSRRLY